MLLLLLLLLLLVMLCGDSGVVVVTVVWIRGPWGGGIPKEHSTLQSPLFAR